MLDLLQVGAYIGKLFAADDRRRVRNPEYLSRMFGRSDYYNRRLLSLGGMQGSKELILEKVDGRTIAYLAVFDGSSPMNPPSRASFPSRKSAPPSQNSTYATS